MLLERSSLARRLAGLGAMTRDEWIFLLIAVALVFALLSITLDMFPA